LRREASVHQCVERARRENWATEMEKAGRIHREELYLLQNKLMRMLKICSTQRDRDSTLSYATPTTSPQLGTRRHR